MQWLWPHVGTVSYTHLDVYKRQVNRFVQEFADSLQAEHGGLVEEIQSTGTLPGAVAEQIRGALEAYKKQVSVSWQE